MLVTSLRCPSRGFVWQRHCESTRLSWNIDVLIRQLMTCHAVLQACAEAAIAQAEAEAVLAATKEKLKAAVRKGRSLEKERDRLQAHVTAREASEVTSRQRLGLQLAFSSRQRSLPSIYHINVLQSGMSKEQAVSVWTSTMLHDPACILCNCAPFGEALYRVRVSVHTLNAMDGVLAAVEFLRSQSLWTSQRSLP